MSQFTEPPDVPESVTRHCPQCGKRFTPTITLCPACGYEFLPRHARIRCQQCGSRIPAETKICPHCHGDPRYERLPMWVKRALLLSGGIVLLLCASWIIFRAVTTNAFARALGWDRTPAAPTRIVQVIQVVATAPPPTRTSTPSPTPTLTPLPSPTPRRTARPATPAQTTTLPTPTIAYTAPQLVGPANRTVYTGGDAHILLEWQSVSPTGLRENEWYQITLTFLRRDASPGEQKTFVKETRWVVPPAWSADLSSDTRALQWSIVVVRVEGLDPFASPTRLPVSPASSTRTFFWN